MAYGFHAEMEAKYAQTARGMYTSCLALFAVLPLAAQVDSVLVMHGGLFRRPQTPGVSPAPPRSPCGRVSLAPPLTTRQWCCRRDNPLTRDGVDTRVPLASPRAQRRESRPVVCNFAEAGGGSQQRRLLK
jgi:hypothetical protein